MPSLFNTSCTERLESHVPGTELEINSHNNILSNVLLLDKGKDSECSSDVICDSVEQA